MVALAYGPYGVNDYVGNEEQEEDRYGWHRYRRAAYTADGPDSNVRHRGEPPRRQCSGGRAKPGCRRRRLRAARETGTCGVRLR